MTGATTLVGTTLTGDLATDSDISMTKVAAGITHSGTAGATAGLAISSTTGFVTINGAGTGTGQYVSVEGVRFAGADIGITADPDLIGLANQAATVRGSVTSTGDLTVGTNAFVVTASNGTRL